VDRASTLVSAWVAKVELIANWLTVNEAIKKQITKKNITKAAPKLLNNYPTKKK
jgi:hypothetical protein